MPPKKQTKNQLIPLCRFAETSQYSQAYLSLLVQRKKLRAKKIGRNYFTTQEWFNEYLLKHARKDRSAAAVRYGSAEKVAKLHKITKAKKQVSTGLLGFSFFVGQKLGKAKSEAAAQISVKPWVGRVIIFAWFFLVVSIYIARFSPNLARQLVSATDRVFLEPGVVIVGVADAISQGKVIGGYKLDVGAVKAEQ